MAFRAKSIDARFGDRSITSIERARTTDSNNESMPAVGFSPSTPATDRPRPHLVTIGC